MNVIDDDQISRDLVDILTKPIKDFSQRNNIYENNEQTSLHIRINVANDERI